MKTIGNFIYAIVVLILVCIALLVGASSLSIEGFPQLFTVQSGSMSPAIPVGSLVVVTTSNQPQVGDVITFRQSSELNTSKPEFTTTHRVVELVNDNGVKYRTKGDANDGADGNLVDPKQVVGRVSWHAPYLGYPVSFAKTKQGLILLVVVPATIIIYSELVSIRNEIEQIIKNKKDPAVEKVKSNA